MSFARVCALASTLLFLAAGAAAQAPPLAFDDMEREAILRHGPWPPPAEKDPSNRVSGDRAAIALGRALFFDERLSSNATVACASCHFPSLAWTDGRKTAVGVGSGVRNAPTLWNARWLAWLGWGGSDDSLWAQALRALTKPSEMGGDAARTAALLRSDPKLSCGYARAFGASPSPDAARDEAIMVDAAKAVAAFVETQVSGRTPFDDFRDALERGDARAMARYPADAQRGLRLFVGKGNCALCHVGPTFTNGEFHDTGMPFFLSDRGVDPGRHEGIKLLQSTPYTRLGPWSDDRAGASATRTRHLDPQHRNFGEFRTPGLRNVARTAPYMHNGGLARLEDVVRHYSELDEERLHADGEQILRPLRLDAGESADLAAFLRSLSSDDRPVEAPGDPCAQP